MTETTAERASATAPPADVMAELEGYRTELTGYCYRMLGAAFEAEDAVQETFVRAWRAYEGFEGRSSLRSWLYRIATNVCLSMLGASQRRARPMDLQPAQSADTPLPPPLSESVWVEPVPDSRVVPDGDPADVAVARESVRLAFVAALQHLPARQRATLILRDVLCWSAAEVAELLGTSVPAVNSALQRARATLAEQGLDTDFARSVQGEQRALLARYVEAFERFDLDALTALLHLDVTLSMPPYANWLRGPAELRQWWSGQGNGCQGSMLCRVAANGSPAFGQYRPGGMPWALQVIEVTNGRITAINSFLDTARLFPLFGLPPRAEA
jgi:RNA polymerase sigma-70 factor, ECF subfamily